MNGNSGFQDVVFYGSAILSISSVTGGILTLPTSYGIMACGHKLVQLSRKEPNHPLKDTFLKVAGYALVIFGGIVGFTGSVLFGIGANIAIFTLGIPYAYMFQQISFIAGLAAGLFAFYEIYNLSRRCSNPNEGVVA